VLLPPAGDIAIVVAGALVAGFVNGLTGTGYALMALGFWLQAMSPLTAAPLVAMAAVIAPRFASAQSFTVDTTASEALRRILLTVKIRYATFDKDENGVQYRCPARRPRLSRSDGGLRYRQPGI